MRLYCPETCERLEVREDWEVWAALEKGFVPSVTEILDIINEGEYLMKWYIKNCVEHYIKNGDKAEALAYKDTTSADFGSICHNLAEAYVQNLPFTCEYTDKHLKMVQPYFEWVDENVDSAIFCEEFFADATLGYGGTADQLLRLKNGELLLADLKFKKNSFKFPMKATVKNKYQLSAYRNHFQPIFGKMRICNFILASPFGWDRNPKIKVYDYGYDDWTSGFEAAKYLWYEKHRVGLEDTRVDNDIFA